jgi:electron transfer flavoprotein beta subunit
MKAVVAVKRVLDYTLKPRISGDQSGVDLTNLKQSINPFDEIAVEEAVRLKEAGLLTEVVVVTIGPQSHQDVLRSALAMGADRAVLVDTSASIQPLTAAKVLQKIIQQENPTLVLLGKQAIDDDCNQTGQMLAALLGWSQGTFASKLVLEGQRAVVTREVDGGLETLRCTLPCVITTDLRLNTPRYLKLPDIMKAKQKPLQTLTLEALEVTPQQTQQCIRVTEPPVRQGGRKVASVDELMTCLTQEAKVI